MNAAISAVQRIVDEGAWAARGATHRLLWLTVLKRTAAGEAYLQSYRRAQPKQVKRWRG